jgi:hypothetical protein
MKLPRIFMVYLLCCANAMMGCAVAPSSITAASVSDENYKTMDCDTLVKERDRVLTTLQAASYDQQSKAGRDAMATAAGVILTPLFYVLLTGESVGATEVARLKGELDTTNRVVNEKKCPGSIGSLAPQ